MSKTDDKLIEIHNKELEILSEELFNMWYETLLQFLSCVYEWEGDFDLKIITDVMKSKINYDFE
jgi:hypothetical protein